MLGRGLESLIPNKSINSPEKPEARLPDPEPTESHQSEASQSIIPAPSYNQEPAPQSTPPLPLAPQPSQPTPITPPEESVQQIDINKIGPNPHQPRKVFDEEALSELASSIGELGVIQPLIVTRFPQPTPLGVEYQLIAGERRLRASQRAGLLTVPAIVKQITEEKEKLEMAIVENIQRDDLNPLEAARSYAKLQEEFGLTQREVASRVGKSRETVSNTLRLLNLPTFIQDSIAEGKMSDSQGRLLLVIEDPIQQKNLFNDIIHNNLSVRELRNKINQLKRPHAKHGVRHETENTPEFLMIEERLQEILGTKVSLKKTHDGGMLTINFYSPEEFDAIVDRLISAPSRPLKSRETSGHDDIQEPTEPEIREESSPHNFV